MLDQLLGLWDQPRALCVAFGAGAGVLCTCRCSEQISSAHSWALNLQGCSQFVGTSDVNLAWDELTRVSAGVWVLILCE